MSLSSASQSPSSASDIVTPSESASSSPNSSISVSNTPASANSQPSAGPSSSSTSFSPMSTPTDSPTSSSTETSSSNVDTSSPTPSPTTSSSSSSPLPPPSSPSSTSSTTSSTSSNSSSTTSSPPITSPTSSPSPSPSSSSPASSPTSSSSESQSSSGISSTSSSTLPSSVSSSGGLSSQSSSTDTSLSSSPSPSQSSSVTIVTFTSVTTAFIDGQFETITSTFTTSSVVSLNTPATSSSLSSQHTGVIIGSAIGGTLAALFLISGIFLLYRRGFRRRASFSPLPTTSRSPPLHEQDFDMEGHSRQPSLPALLPIRGSDSGSIFREEVWPPPNTGSRLQDPLLAASNIDLTSIVDAVMGSSHPRWSSANMSASSEPLLGQDAPDGHSLRPSTSGSNQMGLGSSPTTPMEFGPGVSQHPVMNPNSPQPPMAGQPAPSQMTTGEANPNSFSGVTPGSSDNSSLPPGAAPPFALFLNRPVNRQRRRDSIQTSGSPPPTEQRTDRSGFGPLMVINDTPGDQDMPLVDLSPIPREGNVNNILRDQPPLYHTLPKLSSELLQPTKRGESSNPAAQ